MPGFENGREELRDLKSVAKDRRDPLPPKAKPIVIWKPIALPGPDGDPRNLNET